MTKYILSVFAFLLIYIQPSLAVEFDAESATRAYLDTLEGAAREKSDVYFEGGYWLILWSTLVAIIVDGLFLRFRWSAKIRGFATRLSSKQWLQPAIYVIPYILLSTAITFPWVVYTQFFREKEYDLMNLSFGGWFNEQLIGLAIGVVIAIVFVMIFFAVIRRFPKGWWVLGTAVMSLFMLVLIRVCSETSSH